MDADDSPFRNIQPELNRDIMQAFARLPASLEAALEGNEGPIDAPMEQMAEGLRNVFMVMLKHLPNIAGATDLAHGRLDALEKRLDALEGS